MSCDSLKALRKAGHVIAAVAVMALLIEAQTVTLPPNSVVNGASFRPATDPNGAVAPGSIVAIFGTNLADDLRMATNIPLPSTLGNTSVIFDGVEVPLFAVSGGQINAQVPFTVSPGEASVQVRRGSETSETRTVTVADVSPAIFAVNQQGTGQGAILISNTATFAAPSGSIPGREAQTVNRLQFISIFATGLGDVTNRPLSGAPPAGGGLSTTLQTPTVTIGGVTVQPSFSGLTGFVGLYQVDVQVSSNTPAGDAVEVFLTIGGVTSNTVTIAVEDPSGGTGPEPIQISGVGEQETQAFALEDGLSVFRMTHSGTSNFAIWLLDNNGQRVRLLVNEIGAFDGSAVVGIDTSGLFKMDVSADGNWTVSIEQPRPTSAPSPPITFSGTGQQASPFVSLSVGLSIFRMTHSGISNFAIRLLDRDGRTVELLVNEIGAFDGSAAVGIDTSGLFIMDVSADGNWTVSIEQPRPTSAPSPPITFSGTGQQASPFVTLPAGLSTFRMTHDGSSNFSIWLLDNNGERVDLLVNEIGAFDGSTQVDITTSGLFIMDISADANWTVSIE